MPKRSPEGELRHSLRLKLLMRRKRESPEFKAEEAEKMRTRRAANPKKYREINNRAKKKARKENPRRFKNYQLKWSYGMSLEEYERKLLEQGGKCLTCGGNNEGKPLVVDHDHSKPKGEGNRALLCRLCNLMIGAAFERPEVLRMAADMLEAYRGP